MEWSGPHGGKIGEGEKMNQIRIGSVISILFAMVLTTSMYSSAAFAQPCGQWVAKVVSAQGVVQTLKTGEKQWRPVKLNDTFCPGDMIRILKLSRADIVLSNDAILRLDQNTTVTFSEPEKEKPFLVNLLNGAAYFFSRVRRSIKVFTPFVNAIVEGTEFYARVESDKAFVSIFEGQVVLTNEAGSTTLAKGQSAVAEAGRTPALQIVVRPRDAVQWTLYYPPILYYRPSDFHASRGWQAVVRKSMEFYMEGDLQRALESLEEMKEEVADSRFFAYRASLLLSVGRVDEASSDIEKAFSLAPNNSQALALQSVIAVVQNEKERALSLAKKAVEADPQSASAQIALSYGLQANFDLRGALNSLENAVTLDPENALAWARLAELRLSFGDLSKALKAAEKAVAFNPNLSRTQTVLGFAHLMEIKTKSSREAFQKAMALDQADPLPRLGLGLAKIRDGSLAEGRAEIEIAASLDPNNSLIRSYLGKAYYEEKRNKLASNQFAMAKELDPSDPTPYFYDAIRKQSINQPVEALHDLQESIELNDNRAVYRSRFLLDSDLAARGASLARIYSDLGFQQLALVEGWKSVNTDPANYSAHRFLADSYAALPRHEVARVSELLQSQLLQPININPVQPHLAESNLFILTGAGPSDLSFNEFNPLFNRNRLALQLSGIAGTHDTLGEEIVQSGVWERLSYSIGQFHYQTDGFRENDHLKKNIYDIFVQGMLSFNTSIMAEFRSTETKNGDLELRFFPNDFLPNLRNREETRSMRLGFRHVFSPHSEIIGTFVYGNLDFRSDDLPAPILAVADRLDQNSYGTEVQHLFRSEYFSLVSGAGYFKIHEKDKFFFELLFLPPTPPEITRNHPHHTNLYLYSQINYPKNFTFTIGGSADFFREGIVDRNQFNPKFGLTWNPFPTTTLRAAIFRTVKRMIIADQTLEPTQVAGFNQFFDDNDGTTSWRYGIAVDQKLSKNLYGGVEYSRRNSDVPYLFSNPPAPTVARTADWEERLGRAYVYWTPHPCLGLSAEYQFEKLDRERADQSDPLGIRHVRTHRAPLGINFYHPLGFSAGVKATYIDQEGKFHLQNTPLDTFMSGEDQFWVFDASISYRLPKRFGLFTVGAKNLFDKSFRYQDSDPLNPMMQPRRLVYGKFTLAF